MTISPHHLAELGVIVVAAGRGERLGAGSPKAFALLDGKTLLEHADRALYAAKDYGRDRWEPRSG